MVYVFTEEEKRIIESCGMMVAEFKRNLKLCNALSNVINAAFEAARILGKKMREAYELCMDVIDDVKLLFEEIRESLFCPVSTRYKVVKFLSKVSGIEKKQIWKMTRKTHLARSCC